MGARCFIVAALGSSFLRRQKALFNSEADQSSALALTAASSFIRFLTAECTANVEHWAPAFAGVTTGSHNASSRASSLVIPAQAEGAFQQRS